MLLLCLIVPPSVPGSRLAPSTRIDLGPLIVRPTPSTREKRFARPSPFVFARAVTGVVCNPTVGKENRCFRRAESSVRDAESVGRHDVAVGKDVTDGTLEPLERRRSDCKDEDTASTDSSVCAEKWEVLGLGVTCKLSSWKSSRMWRNERGRDAGLIRITGGVDSSCSLPSSVDRFRAWVLAYTASSMPTSSRFELPLSIAMSSEGGRASARAGVDCQEGKFDSVKVGLGEGILGDAEGVITGNTVS